MLVNNIHSTELASSVQTVKARVELYNGSTLEKICNCGEVLNEFTIDRTGEGKFFGFGICQKLQAILMDGDKEINLTPNHTIEASFGVGSDFIYPFPKFYIEELSRDVDTNDLTVTAYDLLYQASTHTVNELGLPASYSIRTFVAACAALLGIPLDVNSVSGSSFDTFYEEGANFSGDENLRSALNAVAEATQTIYYIDNNWELTFKRLDRNGLPVLTVEKTDFLGFINNGIITLSNISHVTELGDNVSASGEVEGVTQYIRENPFWELREDVSTLIEAAQAVVGGTSINQFECEWFGNYLLEIGDKIRLLTPEDEEIVTYVMDDTIYFDGSFGHIMKWHYDENSAENESNPASLGEVLNQTFARVDKANKQITLLVSETEAASSKIATLEMNAQGISAAVSALKTSTEESVGAINDNFETLSNQVSAKMSAEDVQITIESEMKKGVDKVQTSTGFTFNEEGLTVNKSGSEMTTQITEDGMTISRSGQATLVADNTGVKAENLHATTYLIIGKNSRFEDYGSDRTGCFWIGG